MAFNRQNTSKFFDMIVRFQKEGLFDASIKSYLGFFPKPNSRHEMVK